MAANLAFIGCYNVFKTVGEHGYLPAALSKRNRRYGTPRGAIIAITAAAVVIIISTRGDLLRLGKIFAFGLLGSYAITSISLDVLRWREGQRGVAFVSGLVATLALVVPWVTSWFTKPTATLYGGRRGGGAAGRSPSSPTAAGSGRGASAISARPRPSGRRRSSRRAARW